MQIDAKSLKDLNNFRLAWSGVVMTTLACRLLPILPAFLCSSKAFNTTSRMLKTGLKSSSICASAQCFSTVGQLKQWTLPGFWDDRLGLKSSASSAVNDITG